MAVNRYDIGSFIFVLLKSARQMNNSEKIEHNKKFILQYSLTVADENLDEQMLRVYTDNEGYIKAVLAFRNAFPDYSIFTEDMTAEDDFVIVHGVFRGTHKAEIFGIPATHRKVEFPVMVKYQVVNDRIINAWPMYDQMELFGQLGAINKPV